MTGVSKTSVYSFIKSHNIPIKKENGLTLVDEDGVSLISAHYLTSRHETMKDVIQDSIDNETQVENIHIISVLEKQLDEKQEVIRGLLQALANEQQLRAVPLLSDKQSSTDEKPPGFFRRILRRR